MARSRRSPAVLATVLAMLGGTVAPVGAELQRWVDEEGRLHITEAPAAEVEVDPAGPRLLPRVNCPEARIRFSLWSEQRSSVGDALVSAKELEMMRELAALCPSDARLQSALADFERRHAVELAAEAKRTRDAEASTGGGSPRRDLARALARFHAGWPREARAELVRLHAAHRHSEPEIGYQLGLVELALGHGSEATELLGHYLSRNPEMSPRRRVEAQAALEAARKVRNERAIYDAVEGRFEQTESRRFRFRWDNATADNRERADTQEAVEQYLELAFEEVGKDLGGVYPREPLEVLFYSPAVFEARFEKMSRFSGFWDGEVIRIKSGLRSADAIQDLIYHEYTHALVQELAGGRRVPGWLNEGLAEIEGKRAGVGLEKALQPRDVLVRNLAEQTARGYHPPLSTFEKHGFSEIDDRTALRRTYSRAYVAVCYLHERVQMRGIVRILKGIGAGKDFEDAFRRVYGKDPEGFERDFERYLADFD